MTTRADAAALLVLPMLVLPLPVICPHVCCVRTQPHFLSEGAEVQSFFVCVRVLIVYSQNQVQIVRYSVVLLRIHLKSLTHVDTLTHHT